MGFNDRGRGGGRGFGGRGGGNRGGSGFNRGGRGGGGGRNFDQGPPSEVIGLLHFIEF